ncbi:MAG: GNAT family N-acetyltransferase [Ktedonobacterales bacterium]
MATMQVRPVTLEGEAVRLEPLALEHVEALYSAGRSDETWRYMASNAGAAPEKMRAWVVAALAIRDAGTALPFATVARASGRVVGATRLFDISLYDRHAEIGHTWLAEEARRTRINTECKYLLLRHAFEEWGTVRVQLKTDRRNERSQHAIERLGAQREGVLRKHMLLESGSFRDTVMYSITDDEWPAVKAGLEAKLARAYGGAGGER